VIRRDALNLKRILKYQDTIGAANILSSLADEHINNINKWFQSLPEKNYKRRIEKRIIQEMENIPNRIDFPSEFLGCIWELYVLVVLTKQDYEILEYDNTSNLKSPDLIVRKNELEFAVECKLSYGAQRSLNERFEAGERLAKFVSEGKTQEAVGEFEFEAVSNSALEDFILEKKEKASEQTEHLDMPAILALCNVNLTKPLGIGPGDIPSRFVDPVALTKPIGNLVVIWYCANHFVFYPQHTKQRSFVIYDNDCVDSTFKEVLRQLNLGRDISNLVDGYRFSKELKPIYDEVQEKLWDMQVRSVLKGNFEKYNQSVKFQGWLNDLSSSISNSCLSHYISFTREMLEIKIAEVENEGSD